MSEHETTMTGDEDGDDERVECTAKVSGMLQPKYLSVWALHANIDRAFAGRIVAGENILR